MKYDFLIIGGGSINLTSGQVEASEPSIAILSVVRDNTDLLDDVFVGLTPDIAVSRNSDGTFDAQVDTHGLKDFTIHLESVS